MDDQRYENVFVSETFFNEVDQIIATFTNDCEINQSNAGLQSQGSGGDHQTFIEMETSEQLGQNIWNQDAETSSVVPYNNNSSHSFDIEDMDVDEAFVQNLIKGSGYSSDDQHSKSSSLDQGEEAADVVIPVNIVSLLESPEDVADYGSINDDVKQPEIKKTGKRERSSAKALKSRKHLSYVGVKCQVCGGRAVGFHYGVDTCAACKIFFYRNNSRSLRHTCPQTTRDEELDPKHSCSRCRMEKCFALGMSIAASKKGRYSYKKRYEYVLKSETQKKTEVQEIPPQPLPIADEAITLGSRISALFSSCVPYPTNFYDSLTSLNNKQTVQNAVLKIEFQQGGPLSVYHDNSYFFSHLGPSPERHVYYDRFRQFQLSLISYLKFAKILPSFTSLARPDQVDLLRGNVVYLTVISKYEDYDIENGLEVHPDGTVFTKEEIREFYHPDYSESLFTISDKLQKLQLDEVERSLLKLVGLFGFGRGITEEGKQSAAKAQDVMIRAFDHVVRKNRHDSEAATVVIGNAMQILSDIQVFKMEATKDFRRHLSKYNPVMRGWLERSLRY